MALSTIEATVSALKSLEPETNGFDELIQVFHTMIDRQLAHPGSAEAYTYKLSRQAFMENLPSVFRKQPENIVVAYGESIGRKPNPRLPIYWVAQRLISGEVFSKSIAHDGIELSSEQLQHFEMGENDIGNALSVSEFQLAWRKFLGPDDVLAVYNYSTARLLKTISADFTPALALKAIRFKENTRNGNLANVVDFLNLDYKGVTPGRAGRRLAATLAIANYLQSR